MLEAPPTQGESATGITYTTGSQEPPFGSDPNFSGATTTFLTQARIGYAQPWQFSYDSGPRLDAERAIA